MRCLSKLIDPLHLFICILSIKCACLEHPQRNPSCFKDTFNVPWIGQNTTPSGLDSQLCNRLASNVGCHDDDLGFISTRKVRRVWRVKALVPRRCFWNRLSFLENRCIDHHQGSEEGGWKPGQDQRVNGKYCLTWLDLTWLVRYLCLESRESGLLGLVRLEGICKMQQHRATFRCTMKYPTTHEPSHIRVGFPWRADCIGTFPKTGRSFITIAMIPASTYYFDRLVSNLPNHKKQSQHSIYRKQFVCESCCPWSLAELSNALS